MSVTKRSIEEKKTGSKKTGKDMNRSPFYTYHPTNSEKTVISEQDQTLKDCLDELLPWLQDGCTLRIEYLEERSVSVCRMFSAEEDWRDRTILSTWHSEPRRAIQSLTYALRTVWNEFPKPPIGNDPFDNDW